MQRGWAPKAYPPAPERIAAALVDTLLGRAYTAEGCGKFLGAYNYRVFAQLWD